MWMLLCILGLLGMAAQASELERPAGLEPEIGFWRSVFAEVSSSQALIHDDRYLSVVYEVIDLPPESSAAQRRSAADKAQARYRRALQHLAAGKRTGLSAIERRVLGLWPADVTNNELREASKRVRLQQGLSDRFRAGLQRSGQWRDYIRRQLRDEGVPEGLAALPHVESSFNPEARSHVGAAGLWQFTRSTGQRFMQVDHVVDGRRDPYLSSEAAARLLAYNYSILQSWPLAITAYNHGVAGMRRAVKTMGTEDIETIIRGYKGRAFGFASRNFYVAFLAALEVEQNAERYFGPVPRLEPRAELVVVLPDYIAVPTLADAFHVDMQTLQQYNPALLSPVWSGTKHVPRGFPLRVPLVDGDAAPAARLAAIPAQQRYGEQTADMYHRVSRGDSLSGIAARYHTSITELVALNGLKDRHRIRIGQVLQLPFAGEAQAAGPALAADAQTYRVRPGDTLGGIAGRAGVDERALLALNNIDNPNRIYPGQKLRLRGADPVAEMVSAAVVPVPSEDPEPVAAPPTVASAPPAVPEATIPADSDGVLDGEAIPLEATALVAEAVDAPAADSTAGDFDEASPLLADPSDYLVATDGSIEVQAAETLGHYADWLGIKTQRLRDINGFSFQEPLVIGRRIRLDLSHVDAEMFAERRIAHHRSMQETFFARYRVKDTTVHRLRSGESVWLLTQQRYKVPVWLLRQYNPDLDMDRVKPGEPVIFPRVEQLEAAAQRRSGALADAS